MGLRISCLGGYRPPKTTSAKKKKKLIEMREELENMEFNKKEMIIFERLGMGEIVLDYASLDETEAYKICEFSHMVNKPYETSRKNRIRYKSRQIMDGRILLADLKKLWKTIKQDYERFCVNFSEEDEQEDVLKYEFPGVLVKYHYLMVYFRFFFQDVYCTLAKQQEIAILAYSEAGFFRRLFEQTVEKMDDCEGDFIDTYPKFVEKMEERISQLELFYTENVLEMHDADQRVF